ncbi:MAG: FAD-dependent oxidoreductase [Gemmatimonadota bacterium]
MPLDPVWEDGAWRPLPQLDSDVECDVCVVGLGGSGLACIGELLDLGVRVVGLDASAVAAGAAGRNGGFLLAGTSAFYHDAVARYGRARARTIYTQTLQEIERIAAETPAAVRRTGSLRIAASAEEAHDCAVQYADLQADGFPVELYDGPEGSGLLIPGDASFDPLLRCRTLALRALDRSAALYARSEAVEIGSGSVRTMRGAVSCAAVIVAVDGALTRVLPELRDVVRTARLQMLATAPTSEVDLPRPVYSRYGFEYWQQLPDRRIAIGGFRDIGGAREWTESVGVTPSVQAALERHLRDVIGVRAAITHRWSATVGYTADGLPVFEEVRPRVWAIGAYSGTGNVIGSICGRAAARLVVHDDPTLAAALLQPA